MNWSLVSPPREATNIPGTAALERVEALAQAVLGMAFRGELVPTEAELARREGRTTSRRTCCSSGCGRSGRYRRDRRAGEQARALLLHGVAPRSKPVREINEVQNFAAVRTFREKYRGKVTLEFIKRLHALIMHNIDHESAGAFRRSDGTGITGCDLMLCPASEIPEALQKTIDHHYRRLEAGYHPFEEAVMFHYFFEAIHPFADGNGRVGREILNRMLRRSRYPRLLFLGSDRNLHIEARLCGNREEYAEMVSVFAKIIVKQRRAILLEKLKEMVVPTKKAGQRELTDFFEA